MTDDDKMSRPEEVVAEFINGAEQFVDPVDALLAKVKADPRAVFDSDVVDVLKNLRQEDEAKFTLVRSQLASAGCNVAILDQIMSVEPERPVRDRKQADVLIGFADDLELFHTADHTGYADIQNNGHRETWPLRGKVFKSWLARRFYGQTGGSPNSEALQSALNVLEATARFEGPERAVFVRIGGMDDKIYLDLGDNAWRAVEIDADGWRIIETPPVRFRRPAGMKPIPSPISGGSIEALRPFLNIASDEDFVLVVAWLVAAMRDRGPYPLLVLSGEQGSAKSTFAAVLRAIIDPNTAPLRTLSRDSRDLFISANNGHILSFDNLSGLPDTVSDNLCRLATGGGFAVRQLYSDNEETLFEAARPIILNGIEDVVARPDLADRSLVLTLAPIADDRRRPEQELWEELEQLRPLILGAILDGVVRAQEMLPHTKHSRLPRMADFAKFASAADTAYWPAGTFMNAYEHNRDAAIEDVIEADPVAMAVRSLMSDIADWHGTATDLLEQLTLRSDERVTRAKAWPANSRGLSNRLRRAAPMLRKLGIEFDHYREGRGRTRIICITATISAIPIENAATKSSASSASSANGSGVHEINGLPDAKLRTNGDVADGTIRNLQPIVHDNPLIKGATDGADGADVNFSENSSADHCGWEELV